MNSSMVFAYMILLSIALLRYSAGKGDAAHVSAMLKEINESRRATGADQE